MLRRLPPAQAEIDRRRTEAQLRDVHRRGDEIKANCKTLIGFVREAWKILEPEATFVEGWVIKAICDHLEAVTRGEIQFLLINVPPGMMKSLLVSVFWPAWEWGPMGLAHLRYLSSSYSEPNVIRDNTKMRRLVEASGIKHCGVITSQWRRTKTPRRNSSTRQPASARAAPGNR